MKPSGTPNLGPSTRRSAIVGALLLLSATVPAAAEEVEYRGAGYLQNFTPACAPKGYVDPVFVNAIYRPRLLGTNGASTRLSFFIPPFYATSYELPKGKLGDRFRRVVGGATGTATEFFATKPRMRITERTPDRVKPKTTSVTLAGQIDNFDGIKGCKADFELNLHYHP